MGYNPRGIGHIFFNHQALEKDTCHQYQQKARDGHHQGHAQLVIFFGFKMVLVIGEEFIDIRWHGHIRYRHHQGGDGDKGIVQPKFTVFKNALFGKKIRIQQAHGKAKIDDQGGDDTLPADITHELMGSYVKRETETGLL